LAETNLERLDRLFPNVLALDAQQTAEALGWDKKRIYNLGEKLPFVRRAGDLLVIAKIALANWLDGNLNVEPQAAPTPSPVSAAPAPRKRGRPRKSLAQFAFQQALMLAFERHAYQHAIAACKSIAVAEDDLSGRQALDSLFSLPSELHASYEEALFDASVQVVAPPKSKIF